MQKVHNNYNDVFDVSQKEMWKCLCGVLRQIPAAINKLILNYAKSFCMFRFFGLTKSGDKLQISYDPKNKILYRDLLHVPVPYDFIYRFYLYDHYGGTIYFQNYNNGKFKYFTITNNNNGNNLLDLRCDQIDIFGDSLDIKIKLNDIEAESEMEKRLERYAIPKIIVSYPVVSCPVEQYHHFIFIVHDLDWGFSFYLRCTNGKPVQVKWLLPEQCLIERLDGLYFIADKLLLITRLGTAFVTPYCGLNLEVTEWEKLIF